MLVGYIIVVHGLFVELKTGAKNITSNFDVADVGTEPIRLKNYIVETVHQLAGRV